MNLLWQQKLCNLQQLKTRSFHVPQPTFLFLLETPLRLSRNMLHGWKDNSMLAKHLAACTYLSSIVSELYDATSMRKSKNRYFLPHFCFPWGRPWGNNAKCCMDGNWTRCLQIVSQHVPIYLQQFPSYSNCMCKKNRRFHVPQPTFCFHHAIWCIDGKTIQCLPNPSQHVPIYLQ